MWHWNYNVKISCYFTVKKRNKKKRTAADGCQKFTVKNIITMFPVLHNGTLVPVYFIAYKHILLSDIMLICQMYLNQNMLFYLKIYWYHHNNILWAHLNWSVLANTIDSVQGNTHKHHQLTWHLNNAINNYRNYRKYNANHPKVHYRWQK